MNRERAKALLPIIHAFAEGKTIQTRESPSDQWFDITGMNNCLHTDQEVPKPMEIWVNIRSDDEIFPYETEYDAKSVAREYGGLGYKHVAVHFREVTE